MANIIKGILVDVMNNKIEVREVEDLNTNYHELLHCCIIDITYREFGGNIKTRIICDDNGLLKEDPIPSAFDVATNGYLVGNLFVAGNTNSSGDLTSLTDEEIEFIMDRCVKEVDKRKMLFII